MLFETENVGLVVPILARPPPLREGASLLLRRVRQAPDRVALVLLLEGHIMTKIQMMSMEGVHCRRILHHQARVLAETMGPSQGSMKAATSLMNALVDDLIMNNRMIQRPAG